MSRSEEFATGQVSRPHFSYRQNSEGHTVTAHHPESGEEIGYLTWSDVDGEVAHVHVDRKHQRQGVATGLWDEAHRIAVERGEVAPRHSGDQTVEGKAWAEAVGGR